MLASACMWLALLLAGAAALGLLQLRVGWRERCVVLRGLRLPEWLLRPIRRWLQADGSPVQLEAAGIDAVEIGWSAKGCLVVGLRGIRVVGLAAAAAAAASVACCEEEPAVPAAGAAGATPPPPTRPRSKQNKGSKKGTYN